jgi:hypothetical protein
MPPGNQNPMPPASAWAAPGANAIAHNAANAAAGCRGQERRLQNMRSLRMRLDAV